MRRRRDRGVSTVEWVVIALIVGVQGIAVWSMFKSSVLQPTAERLGDCVEAAAGDGALCRDRPVAAAAPRPASGAPGSGPGGASTSPSEGLTADELAGAVMTAEERRRLRDELTRRQRELEEQVRRAQGRVEALEVLSAFLDWTKAGAQLATNFIPGVGGAVAGIAFGVVEGEDAAAVETVKAAPSLLDEALRPLTERSLEWVAETLGVSVEEARDIVRNATDMRSVLGPLDRIIGVTSKATDGYAFAEASVELADKLWRWVFGGDDR